MKTEYALEVRNENGFVRQIDVFSTFEEANQCWKEYEDELNENEYLDIIFIDYDENGDEIEFGSML